MFGKKKPKPVTFKGLLPKLLSEFLGKQIHIEAVTVDPIGIIMIKSGPVTLRYTASGFELIVKKTGNEVYDAILKNKLIEKFKAVSEGEEIFTMKVEPKFGFFYELHEFVFLDARREYKELLGKIKKKKK